MQLIEGLSVLEYPFVPLASDRTAMHEVPDISDNETWIIRTTLQERYKEEVELQMADAEIRLQPSDKNLTPCPAWYWQVENCHFIIFKTGTRKYRSQFFYRAYQQYTECVVSLLQAQADHEAKERGDL
jgi:hypothetical protein